MQEIDVLEGLLNGDQTMPSMGELIDIPTEDPSVDPKDIELLYEDLSDTKHGTGQSLDDIAAVVADTDMNAAEQGATMQFLKMEALVSSICDMSAKKRHGLLTGDPGVGKCLCYDQLITIRVDDENAKIIEDFLNTQSA
jgi:hypothetical protein